MGDVLDLDTLKAEATGGAFSFSLAGQQFEMPRIGDLDRRELRPIIKAFDSEDIDAGLHMLLGDEQWPRFDKLPMTVEQLNGLITAYFKSQGITPGESSASTVS